MTKQNFLDLFYIGYDELVDLSSPGIAPVELSLIVSRVQEDMVLTTYNSKSNRLQEGFEESEKRIQDLGELVRYKKFIAFSPGFLDNSVQITLPNSLIDIGPTNFTDVYWFTIYEDGISNVLDCSIANNTTVYVKPKIEDISHGQLKTALKDPFRKPYIKGNDGKVLRLRTEGRKHLLITNSTFNLTSYTVGYIRKPLPIDMTTNLSGQVSELAEHKHRELLQETINYCLRITKQTEEFTIENQIPKE